MVLVQKIQKMSIQVKITMVKLREVYFGRNESEDLLMSDNLLDERIGLIEPELDEEVESDEDDGIPRVTRKGTLAKFLKSKVHGRIASDSRELLLNQLEQITLMLIKRASECAKEHNRQTVFVEDLEIAYEELLKPHIFIESIVQTLEVQKDELKSLAKSSLIRHMEVE